VPARTGPTFTRPPTPDTGEAARRASFEDLLLDRAGVLGETENRGDVLLLAAIAGEFVQAVERANSSRALLRQQPLDYVDAVLLDGTTGQLVVDAVEYDAAPVYWQARVGKIERILHGADLDAYLRTGEARYAERIGLA
jgi:hypothetical protein